MKTLNKTVILSFITASVLTSNWTCNAFASEIVSGTGNLEATLGSSYHTEQEAFGAARCIAAPVSTPAGKAEADLDFSESMSEDKVSSELGFTVGMKARFGIVKASAGASFLKESSSSALSVSAVWESSYKFPVSKLILDNSQLSDIGKNVMANPAQSDERWSKTCGDEFVTELTRGAKLFFSVRVDFASEQDKNAFSADFSLSGPFAGVQTTMKQASERFGRRTKVTVSAFQIGGDVSKISEIFGQTDEGRGQFLQCTLGDFENCGKVIESAVNYASNTTTGFPSQLEDGKFGPATLVYRTAPYTDIGIYPAHYPFADQVIKLARKELSDTFEHQYDLDITADRLLAQKTIGDRAPLIRAEKAKIDKNIDAVMSVSQICYETPLGCFDAVHALSLEQIDEKEFEPMSFLKYCEQAQSLSSDDPLRITIDMFRETMAREGHGQNLSCEDLTSFVLQEKVLWLNRFAVNYDGSMGPVIASELSDLRPLSSLTNLIGLEIDYARIKDIAPLANLENLQTLNLPHNRISDVSALEGLKDLICLSLDYNQISDVAPIAGLLRLQTLNLRFNLISDPSKLVFFPEMHWFFFAGNPMTKDAYFKLFPQIHPSQGSDPYWN